MAASGISCQDRAELLTFLLFRPATVPPPHVPVFPLFFLPDDPGVDGPHALVFLLRLGLGLAHTQSGTTFTLEGIETEPDTSPSSQASSGHLRQV